MALLIEGDFMGKAAKVEVGLDTSNKPKVRIDVQLVGGQHDGKRFPYDGRLDEKNIRFTKAHLVALGWQGKTLRTLREDVERAALTIPVTLRIARFTRDDGVVREWTSVDKIGGPPPLVDMPAEKMRDVDAWFAEADRTEGGGANGAKPTLPNDLPF
jgi:hypothetical protein